MKAAYVISMVALGGVLTPNPAWVTKAQAAEADCAKIVAVLDEGGGGLSADEVAKRTGSDVATVRTCTDAWRSKMKDPSAPKGASAAPKPVAPGCAAVVAVLDEGGGGLSADEVAKKTGTDVQKVRACTDQWRAGMKDGAHP